MAVPKPIRIKASFGEKNSTVPGNPIEGYRSLLAAAAPTEIISTGDPRLDRLLLHGIATAKSLQVALPSGVTMNWTLPARVQHEIDPGDPGYWTSYGTSIIYEGSYQSAPFYIGFAFTP